MSKPMSPGRRDAHDRVQVGAVVVQGRARRRGRSARSPRCPVSNRPSVEGLVSIRQATSSSALARRSSTSTLPRASVADLDHLVAAPSSPSPGWSRVRCRASATLVLAARRGPRGRRASAARRRARPASRRTAGARRAAGRRSRASASCKPPHQLERALGAARILERVQPGVAGQRRDPLVQLGVVLHRARAERVEAGVEIEVALRQAVVVADDLGLGDLRAAAAARRGERRPGAARRAGAPARRAPGPRTRAGPASSARRSSACRRPRGSRSHAPTASPFGRSPRRRARPPAGRCRPWSAAR